MSADGIRDPSATPGGPGVGPVRAVTAASGALIVGSLPMFLVGSLSPRISADLGIGSAAVGSLVAAFFLSGAVSSIPVGRLTDRLGSTVALRAAGVTAGATSLGVAVLGHGHVTMLMLLVLGGTAMAMADTGGARAIAAAVPVARHGTAFGGKEASIPTSSMLAGLAVPALGTQLGWRAAFATAAVLATMFVVSVPRGLARPEGDRHRPRGVATVGIGRRAADGVGDLAPRSAAIASDTPTAAGPARRRVVLVLLAVAAGLGGAAATSAPTFLVPAAVAGGWAEATAGFVLAGASVLGVATRLTVGVLADRRPHVEIRLMTLLLIVGAVGLATLRVAGPVTVPLGAMLAIGAGWGWTGLVFLAAVRTQPDRPAGAAGIVLAGLASGGALGPVVFGGITDMVGYPSAWATAGGSMTAAAVCALFADRRRRAELARDGLSA